MLQTCCPATNHVFVPALALIKKMIDYKFGPGQLVETFGYPKLVKYCADKGGKQRGTVLHEHGQTHVQPQPSTVHI
jgi:hypothetical protein